MLDSKVGNPYVNKASVEGVVLKQGKNKKIRVFKYKSKDRSNRRTLGHRQPYTKVEIKKINGEFSMIQVKVKKNLSQIKEITIAGHANYDEYGKDIVCSSVSSIVITTVNGISELNPNYLEILEEENKIIIQIKEEDEIGMKLIQNMLSLLKELSDNYPKNIIVK